MTAIYSALFDVCYLSHSRASVVLQLPYTTSSSPSGRYYLIVASTVTARLLVSLYIVRTVYSSTEPPFSTGLFHLTVD